MSLLQFNAAPSDRQLRQFGLICVFALPLLAWIWTGRLTVTGWAAVAGIALGAAGMAVPQLLKPVFLGLMILAMPIGLVVGELALLLIYFGLFLPMAIAFRIIGRDALQRRIRADQQSFWQPRKQPAGVRKYYQQS
ncbi:MAG: SxtJ family membrane protein [Fuerstiella sp.]